MACVNNCVTDDSNHRGLRLLRDLEGFLLGRNEGSPVRASVGTLVGEAEDRPTSAGTEGEI